MKNLDASNVYRSEGQISIEFIRSIEEKHNIKLPNIYVKFINKFNGARLEADTFDYFDSNTKRRNRDSIAFTNVTGIIDDIKSLLFQTTDDKNDPDVSKFYKYFDKWLIPFGETGGGDFICFDYRNNHKTDNPPIIFWCHDAWDDQDRISFIANNFEEFINMLYEPED